jgi:hypothetical protein
LLTAQDFQRVERTGSFDSQDATNRNFNPHNQDTIQVKDFPIGLHVWTVDRRFGDIRPAEIDTMPHLFTRTTFNEGLYGEYNTIGNNFSARQNRIFADRSLSSQFIFTDPYGFVRPQPEEQHFTNTLSPLTNMSYYSCGDKTNGEDRLTAKFAVNANKRLGAGFNLDYAYARGYFSNQNTSHFGATLFGSYLGDHYRMHIVLASRQHKTSENGGLESDEYVTHPEAFSESYSENEIPTILSSNWNSNKTQHVFLTHRYNVGFYKKAAPDSLVLAQSSSALTDTTANAIPDSLMRSVFVPVTSFLHTLEMNHASRRYIAYISPDNYYNNTFLANDSINDKTNHLQIKNLVGIALLEGFNKYAKAGLTAFAAHELRTFELPDTATTGLVGQKKFTEHNISIGGKLSKTQGQTLHYNATAELWLAGEDAGQLKADFSTDLNFPLFGDTVQLAASAYFYRLNPVFYQRHYHARNLWWDNSLDKETRTRIEGRFTYGKTNTSLRVAVEELQNYTYFGMSYNRADNTVTNFSAGVYQKSGNINVLTAQLCQDFRLGPLNWENVVTFQNSSNTDVLPLPALNVFTNLYLGFKIARVLSVELGADATFFTKYYAPDFCPQLNQFAVQQTADSRVKLGGYPFVNAYANMHLKRARFYIMMTNLFAGKANKMSFLAPHYPTDSSILRLGISWNFLN